MFQVSYSYVISVKLCGEEMKYCSISLLFGAAEVDMELIGSRISCSALFFSCSSVAALHTDPDKLKNMRDSITLEFMQRYDSI